jgi:regulatory protein
MLCHRQEMAHRANRGAAGPAPDAAALHEAAMAYLARYAATEAGVRRVLERRVDRWARRAAGAGDTETVDVQAAASLAAIREVVARLVAEGAVNDAAYAESRARSLARAGRSRRVVAAHLAAKGVDPATAHNVLPRDDEDELAAALVLARRRRLGPFRMGNAPDAARRRNELAVLARAGFPQPIARRALAMDAEEALLLVNRLRR